MVGRTAGGVTSLEDDNFRAPEIAIYPHTYLDASSIHSSGTNGLRACSVLVLHEQTRLQPDLFSQ